MVIEMGVGMGMCSMVNETLGVADGVPSQSQPITQMHKPSRRVSNGLGVWFPQEGDRYDERTPSLPNGFKLM